MLVSEDIVRPAPDADVTHGGQCKRKCSCDQWRREFPEGRDQERRREVDKEGKVPVLKGSAKCFFTPTPLSYHRRR